MDTVHAIYENGVFRPVAPVPLPERAEVEFEPRLVSNGFDPAEAEAAEKLRTVYALLSERFASGHIDTAARHNEHQP